MANTRMTKILEQGVSPDAFEEPPEVSDAPEGATKVRPGRPVREIKPCRMCQLPLARGAETAIGVHIRCVADNKFNRINIPRPTYGARKR